MSDQEEYVLCGQSLAKLIPTAELRWVSGGTNPLTMQPISVLQQKWVASAKMPDGGMWEEHQWRPIPFEQHPQS
jgi:hypothetical protein